LTAASGSGRAGHRLFAGATALALVPRVVQVLLMSDVTVNPHWSHPVMDAAAFDDMARGLLAGTWPTAEPFFTAPLYPFVLGALYAVFGAGAMLPVLLVHALVSALGAGFAALTARRLWGERAGWLAGAIYALLWTSIFFAAELVAVSFTVTLLLLAVWLLLRADAGARGGFFGAGVALGAACLARPNLLVLAPLWLWFAARPGGGRWRVRRSLPFAVGLALAILPATAYNVLRGGAPVVIANSGGVNFYIGNNPEADGASVVLPGIPPSRLDMVQNLDRAAERETGRLLDPAAVDRHFLRKGLAFWAEQPGRGLALQLRKLGLVVGMHERSNNKHLYFWRDRSALLRWPLWLGFTPVLLLAALGFWRRDLAPDVRRLLLGSGVVFAVTLAVFFVNGRFRLPLVALLVVPAAGGIDWLWRLRRARRWDVSRAAVAGVLALAAVSIVPDLVTYSPRAGFGDPAIWYTLGQGYEANGDRERAIQSYRQALRQQQARPQPTFGLIEEPLYSSLGDLLTLSGRLREAQLLYASWVGTNPRSAAAHVRLGDLLLKAGQIDDAANEFTTVLKRDPEQRDARLGLAWVQLYRGESAPALAAFEALHRAEPNAYALFGAGLALIQLERIDEAIRTFREVLVVDPGYWQAWGNLGDLYARQGQPDKAAEAFRKVLEANPQDQTAREWLQAHPGR